jgi:hypothetical protein
MFVREDPGLQRTSEERELTASLVRSYAATRSNQRRHRRKQSSQILEPDSPRNHKFFARTRQDSVRKGNSWTPCSSELQNSSALPLYYRLHHTPAPQPTPKAADCTPAERRSLQFFAVRTAPEWSAWSDSHFWTVIVFQAGTEHTCIRHSLIALAAGHEAMQGPISRDEQEYSWALHQGRQALSQVQAQYHVLSPAVLLMSHILILALTTILDERLMYSAMKALYDLQNQLQRQMIEAPATVSEHDRFLIAEYLSPLISKQKAKLGSLVDILWSLQNNQTAHFGSVDVEQMSISKTFRTTEHARSTLDRLLNSIARTYRCLRAEDRASETATRKMASWMAAVGALQFTTLHKGGEVQPRELCNIELLRMSAQVYFMLITIMQAEEVHELCFDQYTEIYRAIARVAKHVLAYMRLHGRISTTLGLESSLISFVGNAASRWCRDPVVRQELFDVLAQYAGREGYESAACWFDISNCLRKIEEGAVKDPRAAEDIPATARVRLVGAEFYLRSGGRMAVKYLQYPYREEDERVVVLPYAGCGHFYTFDRFAEQPGAKPDVIINRGFTCWLSHESSDHYYMVDRPKFHFNVTKV